MATIPASGVFPALDAFGKELLRLPSESAVESDIEHPGCARKGGVHTL